jgi:hypothetical protein
MGQLLRSAVTILLTTRLATLEALSAGRGSSKIIAKGLVSMDSWTTSLRFTMHPA